MHRHSVPDDIVLKAFSIFRSDARKDNHATPYAIERFMAYIESGKLSLTKARQTLNDAEKVSAFVDETQDILEKHQAQVRAEIAEVNKQLSEQELRHIALVSKDLLEKTHANSEKTLHTQDEMRTESKDILGTIHTELSKLHGVTTELHAASKNLIGQTAKSAVTLENVVKNTSTRTAVIVGFTVGFFAGIPSGIISGIPASYIYERHFSIDAMKNKAQAAASDPPQPAKAQGSDVPSPAAPSGAPTTPPVLQLGPNGLYDPTTGKAPNLLELNENITIRIITPLPVRHHPHHVAHKPHQAKRLHQ